MALRVDRDNSEVVLIRLESDRVVILDRRVLTKQHGRLFLESLPPCTARQGPAAKLESGWGYNIVYPLIKEIQEDRK